MINNLVILFIICIFADNLISNNIMEEIWKDIDNIPNYQISNLGNIRSLDREVKCYKGNKLVKGRNIIPDKYGRINVNQHVYNVKSLLFQNFPEEYVNKFIEENTLPGEEWRDVIGYEGYYKVSSLGRVMSLPLTMGMKTTGKYHSDCPSRKLGRILKPSGMGKPDKYGDSRYQVGLCKNNKSKSRLVNRLVAEAFIPNPNNLEEVNHKNKDFTDNRVENLEWVSSWDNKQHAYINKYSMISLYKLANEEGVTPTKMLDILIENYTSNHQ